jgi:hypothetical protein
MAQQVRRAERGASLGQASMCGRGVVPAHEAAEVAPAARAGLTLSQQRRQLVPVRRRQAVAGGEDGRHGRVGGGGGGPRKACGPRRRRRRPHALPLVQATADALWLRRRRLLQCARASRGSGDGGGGRRGGGGWWRRRRQRLLSPGRLRRCALLHAAVAAAVAAELLRLRRVCGGGARGGRGSGGRHPHGCQGWLQCRQHGLLLQLGQLLLAPLLQRRLLHTQLLLLLLLLQRLRERLLGARRRIHAALLPQRVAEKELQHGRLRGGHLLHLLRLLRQTVRRPPRRRRGGRRQPRAGRRPRPPPAVAAARQVQREACGRGRSHHCLCGGRRQPHAAQPRQEGLVVGRHAGGGAPRVAEELVQRVNRRPRVLRSMGGGGKHDGAQHPHGLERPAHGGASTQQRDTADRAKNGCNKCQCHGFPATTARPHPPPSPPPRPNRVCLSTHTLNTYPTHTTYAHLAQRLLQRAAAQRQRLLHPREAGLADGAAQVVAGQQRVHDVQVLQREVGRDERQSLLASTIAAVDLRGERSKPLPLRRRLLLPLLLLLRHLPPLLPLLLLLLPLRLPLLPALLVRRQVARDAVAAQHAARKVVVQQRRRRTALRHRTCIHCGGPGRGRRTQARSAKAPAHPKQEPRRLLRFPQGDAGRLLRVRRDQPLNRLAAKGNAAAFEFKV